MPDDKPQLKAFRCRHDILADRPLRDPITLHRSLTQTLGPGQELTEDRTVLGRRGLRVSQTRQIAVRPTIALLVRHHQVSQLGRFLSKAPGTNRVAEAAAPTNVSDLLPGEVGAVFRV
jgi:hypothetical protein